MRLLQLASVTVHLMAAAAWFGSMVFLVAVLIPSLRGRAAAERRELVAATGRRLRALAWWLFGILLATGSFQLFLRGYRWPDFAGPMWQGSAGHALACKLGLFAVALGIGAVHDFGFGPRAAQAPAGSVEAERARRVASSLGRLSMLLAVGILAAAVAYVRGGFRP